MTSSLMANCKAAVFAELGIVSPLAGPVGRTYMATSSIWTQAHATVAFFAEVGGAGGPAGKNVRLVFPVDWRRDVPLREESRV